MAFFDINEQYKDNILAIDDEKNQVSYSDLYEYAMKMSDVIDHRCLVFLFASNSIGSIVNYLSFLNNRIVPVLLNWQIEKELASNLLDLYKPE